MKSIKIFNIDNEKKLALVNTLIFALIAVVLYFTLPTVLNYPPNSIDNNFQIEIVGIKYSVFDYNFNFISFIIHSIKNCI